MPRPKNFILGQENCYPLYRRLGWLWGQSGQVRKIFPPWEFESLTIQHIAISSTGYAVLARTKVYALVYEYGGGMCYCNTGTFLLNYTKKCHRLSILFGKSTSLCMMVYKDKYNHHAQTSKENLVEYLQI